ncbi:MAG: DNA gyrase subunit B, partial [Gammaproteobacteria bacterium]|nr:DNA gyrase subunit B [Gammaproteobacteria bacterium]
IAIDGATLTPTRGGPPSGADLAGLSRNFLNVSSTINRLSQRYDSRLLHMLMQIPTIDAATLADEARVAAIVSSLQERFPAAGNGSARYEFSYGMDPRSEAYEIVLDRVEHGSARHYRIDSEFISSSEYQSMHELGTKLQALFEAGPATLQRGDREQVVTDFGQTLDWLMAEARRGQALQRYKGLGEMNPDQLWETTMDPSTRRLLRVNIEDVVAADEVFTTLMGDQVEPRREFIEKNALLVSNLDI